MEWIIFALIIYLTWRYFSKKINQKTIKDDGFKTIVSEYAVPEKQINTDKIEEASPGEVVLSKKSTFPITLLNCNRELAQTIKNKIDGLEYYGTYKQARDIMPLLLENGLKCKEVEEYIANFKPIYKNIIDELTRNSIEWNNASEKDKIDILYAFKKQAYQGLEIRPFIDLDIMLDDVEMDLLTTRKLSEKYGFENLFFYMRLANDIKKVRIVQADHRDRQRYEELVEAGLAKQGKDIELRLILENMKLKELNELSEGEKNVFNRKAEAVEYLLKNPETIRRLERKISFRELFKLEDLLGENISIDLVKNAIEYYKILSELMVHTYSFGVHAYQRCREDIRDSSIISGWEVAVAGDGSTCEFCKKMSENKYSKKDYPKTPLHIGCRCTPMAILKIH